MTAPIWGFQEAIELETIEQKLLPRTSVGESPVFKYFPFDAKEDTLVRWEQLDNFTGLQQFRGYGASPPRVSRIGAKGYIALPGVYGEHIELSEEELTRRRRAGTFGTLIPIGDMVAEAQLQLLNRRVSRQEKILWDLVIAGTYSVTDPNNSSITLMTDSYTVQTSNGGSAWSTHSTSTPLADIRAAQLLSLGQSVNFGAEAELVMNRVQFNNMIANSNAADLGGKRLNYGTTINSVNDINKILAGEDLPQIRVYEGGYLPDGGGSFTRFVATNKAVLFGKRTTGAPVGSFQYTMNRAVPDGGAKPYTRVIDTGMYGRVPGTVEVHDGFNGGPTIKYPGAVVIIASI